MIEGEEEGEVSLSCLSSCTPETLSLFLFYYHVLLSSPVCIIARFIGHHYHPVIGHPVSGHRHHRRPCFSSIFFQPPPAVPLPQCVSALTPPAFSSPCPLPPVPAPSLPHRPGQPEVKTCFSLPLSLSSLSLSGISSLSLSLLSGIFRNLQEFHQ